MIKKVTTTKTEVYLVDADDDAEARFLALNDEYEDKWTEDEEVTYVEDM